MADPAPDLSVTRLGDIAANFVYPPTPDIAAYERWRLAPGQLPARGFNTGASGLAKLLAGAVAAMVLLLVVALLVPQTRAALLDFLDIGAIRIFADEEPAEPLPAPDRTLLDLAGATTLTEASDMVDFDVRLPAYPADLGQPGQVFVQELDDPESAGQIVILVWLDPERPDEAQLSLYQIGAPFYGLKQALQESIRTTTMNGQPAAWVEGPHRLQLLDGDYRDWFFVPGSVLVWTDGELTYRLESGLAMEEAMRIAESLVAGG
jgi:hypothetical protein